MNSSAHQVVKKLLVVLLIECQDVATKEKPYVSGSAQLCCILWKGHALNLTLLKTRRMLHEIIQLFSVITVMFRHQRLKELFWSLGTNAGKRSADR